ncbi:hypothetical protein [Spirochaeta dissipatitropha]
MKKALGILLVVFAALAVGCATSTGVPADGLFEDFESDAAFSAWNVFDWQENALNAGETDQATRGSRALRVDFRLDGSSSAQFGIDEPAISNWHNVSKVVVDINNLADSPVMMTVAPNTGDGWTWYESSDVEIQPGLNESVEFDIRNNVKSEASNWANTGTTENLHDVKRVAFSIHGAAGIRGAVVLDNIRLITE